MGKSTFIKVLEDAAVNEDWEITPEPVSTWTQIHGHMSWNFHSASSSFSKLPPTCDDPRYYVNLIPILNPKINKLDKKNKDYD